MKAGDRVKIKSKSSGRSLEEVIIGKKGDWDMTGYITEIHGENYTVTYRWPLEYSIGDWYLEDDLVPYHDLEPELFEI